MECGGTRSWSSAESAILGFGGRWFMAGSVN
jgi:hypothetical protein